MRRRQLRLDVVAAMLTDEPRPVGDLYRALPDEVSVGYPTFRADLVALQDLGRARRCDGGWVRAERQLLEV